MKFLILLLLLLNSISANDFDELLNDIGNEASIGVGFGYHKSKNDYIEHSFKDMVFYQASINAFIGSRDLQLRFLGFGHYSKGAVIRNGFPVGGEFDFFELSGNIGFAADFFAKPYLPAFSLMGSMNYYVMDRENRFDPGFYTSAYWNFSATTNLDYGVEIYHNLVFDKINSEFDEGNGGNYGIRVYANFIGTIIKNDENNEYTE